MAGKVLESQHTSLKPPPQQASFQEHLNCSRKIPLYCTWTVFRGAKMLVPTDSALVCKFHVGQQPRTTTSSVSQVQAVSQQYDGM